jgi:cytochrome c biogenesis protein CcmG, thiol:disulfide interchange protein DsbE
MRSERAGSCWRAALALWLFVASGGAFAATVGEPAPAITARLFDGTTFDLADYAGKVVVVNMWATWCAPCREEMPALDRYYLQHRDQGLVMVALSMDNPKDSGKVREITAGYAFAAGFAADARMKGYGRIWRLPMTFVIDRRGILKKDQWYSEDGLTAAALDETITPLLRVQP